MYVVYYAGIFNCGYVRYWPNWKNFILVGSRESAKFSTKEEAIEWTKKFCFFYRYFMSAGYISELYSR